MSQELVGFLATAPVIVMESDRGLVRLFLPRKQAILYLSINNPTLAKRYRMIKMVFMPSFTYVARDHQIHGQKLIDSGAYPIALNGQPCVATPPIILIVGEITVHGDEHQKMSGLDPAAFARCCCCHADTLRSASCPSSSMVRLDGLVVCCRSC